MISRISLVALAVLFVATSASAQVNDSQTYTVTVPTSITITAPSDASLTHDESDDDQVFPAQQWDVSANTAAGVTVSFATDDAFTHTTDGSFQRDARLDLSVNSSSGPAVWSVPQASAQTDYAGGTGVATVQATSDGVGSATFDLAVTFITDGFGTFASGDYQTTVTGTVTAN